jgi:uncharacterized BrkB/YihY/UPF0761 family membrane protein
LAIGFVLTLYASMSLVRALRITHPLAWEELPRRRRDLLRDGAIVSAATLLAWLFVVSRIMVSSAFVNATLWRRRSLAAEPSG